jgi:arsenite methyltransferase
MSRDLLHQSEIRALVRAAYGSIDGTSRAVAEKLYSAEELTGLPALVVDHALGVANPVRHARIERGDTVLDLGCGFGIDSILAARRTGPGGRVLALDFLPEMLQRTASAAAEAGVGNVETIEGEMEAIPLEGSSVDVVISNGVVNLSPRKARALAECARVLRPGGQLCVADVTVEDEELPPEVLTHPAAWAG